jgi:outer membrane protein TolC
LAPQAPNQPWQPSSEQVGVPSENSKPQAKKFELPASMSNVTIHKEIPLDKNHVYNLAELIDLAQCVNPDTRLAWEQSKQAALAVGLTKASYLPQLSAVVLGGQQYTPLPGPRLLFPKGHFVANTAEVLPSLVIKWLLFDFGKRNSLLKSANQLSLASNIEFTGAHQKLIFDVSKAYFILDAERKQLQVAQSALKNAKIVQDAAEDKHKQGLETITRVAIARRVTAKARYELEKAKAVDHDAYHALMQAVGLTPTANLKIAGSSHLVLPKGISGDVNTYIKRALAKRPDLAAALAKLRASKADVSSAKAAYLPTLAFEGIGYQNIGSLKIDNFPTTQVNRPASALFLKLSLPLYDGGTRRDTVRIAQSKNAAAREAFAKIQDEAIRQVARAYDTVKSALAEYESAKALLSASNTAYHATLDSYRQGLETFTNLVIAETERVQAESALANAHAAVLTAAAALAFSTGELTSTDALKQSHS